jgi:hypothetical protein
MKLHWLVGAGVVGFLGCATAGPQVDQEKALANASLSTADSSGANQTTEAASHLRQAHDEQAQANKAAKDGDDDRALQLFQRAQADADLATAMARETNLAGQATAAEQKLQQAQAQQNGNP